MANKVLPRHETTLLLDDIREEMGGKLTLVGLYGTDILIDNPPPVTIPKLCVFTRYTGGDGEFDVRFSLKGPDGEETLANRSVMKMRAGQGPYGNINLVVSPFVVKKEGVFRFTLFLDDRELCTMPFSIKTKRLV